MKVFTTTAYERAIVKMATPKERKAAEGAIIADPSKAPAIRGTGGIRKARAAVSGRGKRGGLRVIYFHHVEADALYLLTVYAKAEQEDLASADWKMWAELVKAIRKEGQR
jgi:hypothetical protein